MDPKAYCYDDFIKTREHAKKLLEEHEKEKDNYKPKYKGDILSILSNPATYHSHLYPKKTEEETKEIFQEIKDKNKDLPINFGFELSHSAHGKMVYAHNLKVETDKISKDIDLDKKLTNLLKDIRKHIDFDY
ncbi:MAG: hypothetical protein PHU12_03410 [Candidatus Aenigmarchaeota archaeon]|nr:hypothetical protein [Candidatus Aenigmarchaeota archaeon]